MNYLDHDPIFETPFDPDHEGPQAQDLAQYGDNETISPVLCLQCYYEADSTDAVCPCCGGVLAETSHPPRRVRRHGRMTWFGNIVIFVIVLLVLLYFL